MLIIILLLKLSGFKREEISKRNLDKLSYNLYENYPNPGFKDKVFYEQIGMVSENKTLFDEFNKTFTYKNRKNLLYFKNEKECYKYNQKTDDKVQYLFELIQMKNNSFNFKFRSNEIYLSNSFSDEESVLIIEKRPVDTKIDLWSYPVHNFLLNYFNKTNNKQFNVYSYGFSDFSCFNIYPSDMSVYLYFFPLSISFIYGIIFLNISLRMIDEKEKKLDILLNRYGIKKYQYYLTWFIYYVILTIFINFCTIFTFSYLTFPKLSPFVILFIINHILFSMGIFSMAFFTQTVVNTLKTGQTFFKILFFGIGVLGIPVILFDTPKIIKIIFSLFPHIAQMENLQIIYLLQRMSYLKFGFYFSKYHKISFAESLFYLLLDILIYFFGGLLILSYK